MASAVSPSPEPRADSMPRRMSSTDSLTAANQPGPYWGSATQVNDATHRAWRARMAGPSLDAGETLTPVFGERLEETEPDAVSGAGGDDQRLVDQARQQIGDVITGDHVIGADLFCRLERAATGEHRHPLEYPALRVEEQAIAPVDTARRVCCRGTAVLEPPVSRRNRSSRRARISPGVKARILAAASSIASGRPSRRAQIMRTVAMVISSAWKTGRDRPRPRREQVTRVAESQRRQQRQRFPGDVQALAAGGQDPEGSAQRASRWSTTRAAPPATCSQLSRTSSACLREKLTHALQHVGGGSGSGSWLHTKRGPHGSGHSAAVGDRRQFDQPRTVGVAAEQAAGHLDRQACLTDPAWANDGNQPAARRAAATVSSSSRRPMSADGAAGRFPVRSADSPPAACGCGPAESGVLAEHHVFQAFQLGPRVHAELVGQHDPCALIGAKRVALPPGPVQRDHELAPEALPAGVLAPERRALRPARCDARASALPRCGLRWRPGVPAPAG